jgi:hypothetical protein
MAVEYMTPNVQDVLDFVANEVLSWRTISENTDEAIFYNTVIEYSAAVIKGTINSN